MNEIIGTLQGNGIRAAVVVSRFNETVTNKLLEGALKGLEQCGVDKNEVTIARVPGAFEIPIVAKKLASSGNFDTVICLGAVIRGETSHFDYVSNEVSSGIARVSYETGIPTIFGILTTDNVEQALDRAGGKKGNKGFDAAHAAIEMVNLLRKVDSAQLKSTDSVSIEESLYNACSNSVP